MRRAFGRITGSFWVSCGDCASRHRNSLDRSRVSTTHPCHGGLKADACKWLCTRRLSEPQAGQHEAASVSANCKNDNGSAAKSQIACNSAVQSPPLFADPTRLLRECRARIIKARSAIGMTSFLLPQALSFTMKCLMPARYFEGARCSFLCARLLHFMAIFIQLARSIRLCGESGQLGSSPAFAISPSSFAVRLSCSVGCG